MERAREVARAHGELRSATNAERAYCVPRAAIETIEREIARGLGEYDSALRAPLRVVALGRSGVGKSHVLNQLLSELASRTPRARGNGGGDDLEDGLEGFGLTIVNSVEHDEAEEERAADRARALEDEGVAHVVMEADASVFAPPPPLDRDKSREVYAPRHMKGRAIAGEAAKFADEAQIRKDRIKELAAKKSKQKSKVKPSYVLFKEHMDEKKRKEEAKAAEKRKLERYETIIKNYELPIRKIPFKPPLVPIEEFLSTSPRAPFLLPEGDVLDTTSVASSVSTSDAFRVTLVYFSEEVVKKHLHALQRAAREARLIELHRPNLGFFAETYVKGEMKKDGDDDLTLLDFSDKAESGADGVADDSHGLESPLRVACAMVGLDPNRSSLETVQDEEVALPAEYIERLGRRVTFEYRPDGVDQVDYSDEETFRRGLLATKQTLVTQTHIPASCWGLLREVRVEIPVPEHKRGLVLIDAPGAGDSDPARDRHLVAALRNAAAVICLGDSRDVTGDVVRALHKSGFLQQLTVRPATRRFINAVQGDRIWGSTLTTFRTAQALLKERLGKDVDIKDFLKEQPPRSEDLQWAVDQVIRENAEELASIRRMEVTLMLSDPNGSVRELPQVANAVVAVAWKFLELRSSWAKVLDPSKVDVQNVTGHGSLYAELETLKHARMLKFVRRVAKRVHDALMNFCAAAGPIHALPECSDESLRGLHESLEVSFGEQADYAGKVILRDATQFLKRTFATHFISSFDKFSARATQDYRPSFKSTVEATLANVQTLGAASVPLVIERAVSAVEALYRNAFSLPTEGKRSDELLKACVTFVDGWYHIVATEGEQSLSYFVQRTLLDLTGKEADPRCAILRAVVTAVLNKLKLSQASKSGYLSVKGKREAAEALHKAVVKALEKELLNQTKAISAGLMSLFSVENPDELNDEWTKEQMREVVSGCSTLASLSSITVADALADALYESVTAWMYPAVTLGTKDAMKCAQNCLMPLVRKQLVQEFRALVARPSMLTIINEDVANVGAVMAVTSSVLGLEAKKELTKLEKAQILISLARAGDEEVKLDKRALDMPPPNPAFRAPDDVVQVELSDFPIRIYAPGVRANDVDEPTSQTAPSDQEFVPIPSLAVSPAPVVSLPTAVSPAPEAPVRITLDIRIVSPDPVAVPSPSRREIAVQTDEPEPSLPSAAGQSTALENRGVRRQNSSSKSGKSDITATPAPVKIASASQSPSAPASFKWCDHCGERTSVWKKGTAIKPKLCLACNQFYEKKWTLPKLSRKSTENTPHEQSVAPRDDAIGVGADDAKKIARGDQSDDARAKRTRSRSAKALAHELDASDVEDSPVPRSEVRPEWVAAYGAVEHVTLGNEVWKSSAVDELEAHLVIHESAPPVKTVVHAPLREPRPSRRQNAIDEHRQNKTPSTNSKRKRPSEGDARVVADTRRRKTAKDPSARSSDDTAVFESDDERATVKDKSAKTKDAKTKNTNKTTKTTKTTKQTETRTRVRKPVVRGKTQASIAPSLTEPPPNARSVKSPIAFLAALGDDDTDERRWREKFANVRSPTKRPHAET